MGTAWDRAGRRVAAVTLVVFGLTVAVPAEAVPSGGSFPVEWLTSWFAQRPVWAGDAFANLPQQARGGATEGEHYVPTDVTRANGGSGRAPEDIPGAVPTRDVSQPRSRPFTTPATDGKYDPSTSRRVAAKSDRVSDVFQNADGSFTRRVHTGPTNFQVGDGPWQPIDTTLQQRADGRLHMAANSIAASVARQGAVAGRDAQQPLASVTLPSGEVFGFDLDGAANVTPEVAGSTAVYRDILALTDMELTTFETGMKDTLVLRSVDAPHSWLYPLHLRGLTPRLEADGSIALLNVAGVAVAWVPRGTMQDSNVELPTGEPTASDQVTYELVETEQGTALRVTADETWLRDPARVYPVRMDPTTYTATTMDAYADYDTSTSSATQNGNSLAVGYDNESAARSFIHFGNFAAEGYLGLQITSARLALFHTWSWNCGSHLPINVHKVLGTWSDTSIAGGVWPGPGISSSIGSLTINDNYPACTNTSANRSTGKWWWVPLGATTFNEWSGGEANLGLAVTADEGNANSWKRFTSSSYLSNAYGPVLELTWLENLAPQVNAQYPAHGYSSPTLTPELIVDATDPDNSPGGMTYQFIVYDKEGALLWDSGFQAARALKVPAGELEWAQTYQWTARAKDTQGVSASQTVNVLSTAVPQPRVTSSLSQNGGHGLEPSIGNYTTSATDATVATVGPGLGVQRSYNSLDPRVKTAFGAGWSSMFDAKATEQKDSGGTVQTVVVRYPSGQEVAFGRNADGVFVPPSGRFSTFTAVSGGYQLVDKDGTKFRFTSAVGMPAGTYGLTSITDVQGRALSFTFDGSGRVTTATAASGRKLFFTWSTPAGATAAHVATVTTDPAVTGVPTSASTWTYTYTGDLLTKVCPPTSATDCHTYGYGTNSLYRSTVLNADPRSYWRLGNSPTAGWASSEVLANVGSDGGLLSNVTMGVAGPLAGSTATAASFNGTSSSIKLQPNVVTGSSYQSVSMWFKASPGDQGVLFSYQKDPVSAATTGGTYTPMLYIGTSGKLHGKFWDGNAANPMQTPSSVADGQWHHVTLAAAGSTQKLYVDGVDRGTLSATVTLMENGSLNPYIGAGYIGGAWPDEPWQSSTDNTGHASYFKGSIAEVAYFDRPIIGDEAVALYGARVQTKPLTSVLRPSGNESAQVVYDTASGLVSQLTDSNGGVWQIAKPVASGSYQAHSSSVLALAPSDYWRYAETGTTQAVNQINGKVALYNNVTLGSVDGPFNDPDRTDDESTAASFNGTSSSVQLPAESIEATYSSQTLWFKTSQAGRVLASHDNRPFLWITPGGKLSAAAPAANLTSRLKVLGKCVDVSGVSPTDGASIVIYTCHGEVNQTWTMHPDGTVRSMGKCLAASYGGVTDGTAVILYTCNGSNDQQWTQDAGRLRNVKASKCLDLESSNTANSSPFKLYSCTTGTNQQVVAGITSSATVTDNQWHHVALVRGAITQTLYLDGVEVDKLYDVALAAPTSATGKIGAGNTGGGIVGLGGNVESYFAGAIGEVALYRTVVEAESVAAQFGARVKSTGAPVKTVVVTDPGSGLTQHVYDANVGSKLAETNALGRTTQYSYNALGFAETIVDPNGNMVTSKRDVRGNVIATVSCQDRSASICSTTYQSFYPDETTRNLTPDPRNDMPLTARDGRSSSKTDNTYLTSFTYDANGNRTAITDALGRATTTSYTDGTTVAAVGGGFAPAGLPAVEKSPGAAVQKIEYFSNGDVARITDPAGKVTTFTYDQLGRKLSSTETTSTFPSGLTTSYTYDKLNHVVTQTSPAVTNRVTGAVHTAVQTNVYDVDGNLTSNSLADTTGGDATRTATFGYNNYGQQTSLTSPGNKTTLTEFDAFGRQTKVTEPDGRQIVTTYDLVGNKLTEKLKSWTGDPNNPTAPVDLPIASYAYDPAGRLATTTDAMGWQDLNTYTDNNLVATVTRKNPSTGATFVTESNTYDSAGTLTRQVTNNGTTRTDTPVDVVGRVTSTVSDLTGLNRSASYTYSSDDQVLSTTVKDGAGAVVGYAESAYDQLGRATTQTTYLSNTSVPAASSRWKLDETSGTTAADAAGNVPAPAAGAVTWSTDNGGSASLAGAGSLTSAAPVLDTNGSFTASVWVKMSDVAGTMKPISAPGTVHPVFDLRFDHDDSKWKYRLARTDTATPTIDLVQSTVLGAINTWTHLTAVYDAQAKTMNLYVNGAAQGSKANVEPYKINAPVLIGAGYLSGSKVHYWKGGLDDVQVFPRALTAAQVAQVFNGTAAEVSRVRNLLDNGGLAKTVIDPNGNATDVTYDEAARAAVVAAPAVNTEVFGGSVVVARPVTYVGYDTFGRQVEIKNANGKINTVGYDADGKAVTATLPSYTPPGSSTPIVPVSTNEYNAAGLLIKSTDALGKFSTYGYDQLGHRTTVTSPVGGVTKYGYDLLGNQLSVTDPTGAVAQATYDYLSRPVTSTQVVSQTSSNHTTSFAYHPSGLLASTTTPTGVVSSQTYNVLGETLTSTDGASTTTSYLYDGAGRQTRTTLPDNTYTTMAYDLGGRQLSVKSYDAANALLRTVSASYDANGNTVSATDGRGTVRTYAYDATNLLASQVEPISALDTVTTSYGYDPSGARTRFTDGRGNQFWTSYNSWGLAESQVEPATAALPNLADRTFTTVYDAAGRAVSQLSPGGVSITSTFDDAGRITGQAGAGAEVTTASRSFGYDLAGRVTSLSGSGGTNTLTYDDRGLLLSAAGPSGASSFAYNGIGQLTSRVDAAGTTAYTYDSAGRPSTVANTGTSVQLAYGYNALSQVAQVTYGTGGNTRWLAYDSLHRLTTDDLKTPGGTSIGKIVYGWDGNDNETSKTTTGFAGATTNTYSYDWADRLTSWTAGSTTVYAYDKSHNRITAGVKSFTYDQRNQLLTASGGTSYEYTARGTLQSTVTGTVAVDTQSDAFNQVTRQYADATTYTDYTYDGLGRAIKPGFAYTGLGNDLATDGTATYTRDAGGAAVGVKQAGVSRHAWTDLHTDLVGQFTAAGTSLDGAVAFDPLGKVLATASMLGNLGYQSEFTEGMTGRVNMLSRWYNPDTGQFDSRDTQTNSPNPNSADANRYAYANANPLTGTDPTGHKMLAEDVGYTKPPTTYTQLYGCEEAMSNRCQKVYANGTYNKTVPTYKPPVKPYKPPPPPKTWGETYNCEVAMSMHCQMIVTTGKLNKPAPVPITVTTIDPIDDPVPAVSAATTNAEAFWSGIYDSTIGAAAEVIPGLKEFYDSFTAHAASNFAALQSGEINIAEYAWSAVKWCWSNCPFSPMALWDSLVETFDDFNTAMTNDGAAGWYALGKLLGTILSAAVGKALKVLGKAAFASVFAGTAMKIIKREPAPNQPGSPTNLEMCSFRPDTPVLMGDGTSKPIAETRVGDTVVATDPQTDETSNQLVTHLHEHIDSEVSDVTLGTRPLFGPVPAAVDRRNTVSGEQAQATDARVATLYTTPNHEIWDETSNAWIPAGQLTPGRSTVIAPDGSVAYVLAVWTRNDPQVMHNLTVANIHTYYVLAGNTPILVHNTSGWCIPEAERFDDVDLIAEGHAGTKHAGDFPGMDANDIADLTRQTMQNPARAKDLARGRKAYQSRDGSTIVVHDPNHPDGGTVFRRDPTTIDDYWEEDLN